MRKPIPPRLEEPDVAIGSIMLAAGIALVLVLSYAYCGCTRAAQLVPLTAMTRAAAASVPTMVLRIQAEEDACFRDGAATFSEASVCVAESRERWAPVLFAIDSLAAADQAALDGSVDLAAVLAAYCVLADAVPSVPAPPAVIGACP